MTQNWNPSYFPGLNGTGISIYYFAPYPVTPLPNDPIQMNIRILIKWMSGYVYCTYVRTYAFLVVYSLHTPLHVQKGASLTSTTKYSYIQSLYFHARNNYPVHLEHRYVIPHHPVSAINLCGAKDYAHKLQIRLWWRTVFGTTWWYCDTPNSYS